VQTAPLAAALLNQTASPGPTIEVVEGDRVRIRAGNLTMTNHPMHLHGHEFVVTDNDGGTWPLAARTPGVTTDVAVGQMRKWSSSPTRKATGPSTATRATTP
jgi:FtsP/CotA-like multicopper oxidase with cupredoxin domain